MDILKVFHDRYTTKHYNPDAKISAEDMDELLEMARLTPSAVNIQPWHFYVGSSDKAKELIMSAIPDFNIPRIRDCSHFVVLCAKTKMSDEELSLITRKETEDGRYTSEHIRTEVDAHRKHFAKMHEDMGDFSEWTAKQTYLAMASLLYGAAAKGIDSTPIEGMDFEKTDMILDLKKNSLRSVAIVALGYRGEDSNADRPKSRLSTKEIISSLD
ncbi:MAG: nitroreductase family protein [Succinivibrio sp.]